MKIGKKIFLSFIVLSFISLILSAGIGLYQLIRVENNVSETYNRNSEVLIENDIKIMADVNAGIVKNFAQNYSQHIDDKLLSTTRHILMVKNYIERIYTDGTVSATAVNLGDGLLRLKSGVSLDDGMLRLQTDVSFNDVENEFQMIRPVINILADITNYDSNGGIYYYASESGLVLYGIQSDFVNDELIMKERDWYTLAVEYGGIAWTPLYTDARTGEPTITVSTPVFDANREICGVIACDILIEPLVNTIIAVPPEEDTVEYVFLLDDSGSDFLGSVSDKTLDDFIGEQTKKDNLINKMLDSTMTGNIYDDGEIMVGYSLLATTGWSVGVLINYQKITEPSFLIGEIINTSSGNFRGYLNDMIRNAIIISITILIILLAVASIASKKIAGSITKPLTLLTESAKKISEGNLEYGLEIKSGDEIETLATAFGTMTRKLSDYIDNLAKVTAEKERISTELNIAKQIQSDMLPNIFPPFPERDEFEIFAMMRPAKEVGGDFYDFFLIDDDHLCVVVADVSGKSIPAALFMVIAKTLINTHIRNKEEPREVFTNVNQQLCEGNEAAMFVTAWMGVLEISTGKMTFVNAGHNPPLIKKSNGVFEYLKTKKGFVLGGMSGIQYKQFDMQLNKGDMLFLYTDGVTEANDSNEKLYGEERLLNALNRLPSLKPADILKAVDNEIGIFAGIAPQFDDITMLALLVN